MPSDASWFTSRANTRLLAAAWGLLLGLRALLLGRGALADYDERRYYQSLAAVRAIVHGRWPEVAYDLSMTAARPVDALWRCLPAAAQLAAQRWLGWDVYDYPSLLLPTVLNLLVSWLAAWVFYRICRRLLATAPAAPQWALVAAVFYAGLANTNLYVRHVLPYDGALLVLLLLLAWVLAWPTQQPGSGRWLGLGVGAGLLWLFYPGYYAGPPLLVLAAADWVRPWRWVGRNLGGLLLLGLGFLGPLLAAEILSRVGGGPPFWAVSYDLSLHILQGEPAEGYTFLPEYLWRVEGPLGVLLLALLALALGQLARVAVRCGLEALVPRTPQQRVLAAAALLFLAHATAAAVGHRIVWYGRLLHLYLPWLVLVSVVALARLRSGVGAVLGAAGCGVALVVFLLFFRVFQPLAYPPDVLAAYRLGCVPPRQLCRYEEVRVPTGFLFPLRPPTGVCPPAPPADSLTVLINFALLYPLEPATRRPAYVAPLGSRVLLRQSYYGSLPAYQFEGLGPAERAEMRRRRFQLVLLRVPGAAANTRQAVP